MSSVVQPVPVTIHEKCRCGASIQLTARYMSDMTRQHESWLQRHQSCWTKR